MTGSVAVRCMLMRGGTSKGAYFLAEDLPADPAERDDLLLRVMGTPDPRQIDGLGGAHPLTSKVAVVSAVRRRRARTSTTCSCRSASTGPTVSDRAELRQPPRRASARSPSSAASCRAGDGETRASGSGWSTPASVATATFPTPGGRVDYAGDAAISGVPGTAAPVVIDVPGTAGSTAARCCPTGRVRDVSTASPVTCVDNGMPVVARPRPPPSASPATRAPRSWRPTPRCADRVESLRLQAGS